MELDLVNDLTEKRVQLVDSFWENTSGEKFNELLGCMLEVYVQHAPVSRIDLANVVTEVTNFQTLITRLTIIDKFVPKANAIIILGLCCF